MNKPPASTSSSAPARLQPLIAGEADEIERTRRLTPAVVDALIENGLYRALLPQSLGGAEAPPEIFMQMQEEIAKADASTAWCLGQCSVCAMIAAYLDPDAAHEIFNTAPGILAWGAIAHEAQAVPGGYRVTGALGFCLGLAAGELARRTCAHRRARRHAAEEAEWRAGNPHHPVPGRQRHDARRLGRDRAERHRHRLLLGRESLRPETNSRSLRDDRQRVRERAAVPAHHQRRFQPRLCRGLARRRAGDA